MNSITGVRIDDVAGRFTAGELHNIRRDFIKQCPADLR
jgi:hypothetical protein